MPDSKNAPKIAEKGEEPQHSKIFKDFEGINTKADRTAIPRNNFYRLDNLIPVGHANIHTVEGHGNVGLDVVVGTPIWQQYANLNGVDYCYVFTQDGKIWQINVTPVNSLTYVNINPSNLLSGVGSRMDYWGGGVTNANEAILFIDSTGYYSWDGTTFVHQTGAGTPSLGTEIAVYAGRVWIFNKRLVECSAVGGYDNTSWGAGTLIVNFTDPQLKGPITRAISCDGYLYAFAKVGINVISDVYVPSGQSTPVLTNTNIEPLIGTDQPGSVFATSREVYFANQFGAHRIQGTTVERISEDIDGTWQYLDFSSPIFGGMAVVQNILCTGFLVKQKNDPYYGSRQVILMAMDKKWFMAVPYYFSAGVGATTLCWGMASGRVAMFTAHASTAFIDVFGYPEWVPSAPNAFGPPTAWATGLDDCGDAITVKEIQQVGVEITNSLGSGAGNLTLNVDTEDSSTVFSSPGLITGIEWSNTSNAVVQWVNNSSQVVAWGTSAYDLFTGDSGGAYGHYIGMSASAPVSAIYQLTGIMMDYLFRNRWTN